MKEKENLPEEISITYKSEQIITRIDDMLMDAMDMLGYRRWASGYTCDEKERDIAFTLKD